MISNVHFMDMRASIKENFLEKLARLVFTAGISGIVSQQDIVAIKLHFGEMGNSAFIRPIYVRRLVEVVREVKACPFLTDANTLYSGTRSNAPNHLITAVRNGFALSVVGAPIVIADGLRGKSETSVKICRKRFDHVYIAKEIVESDVILSVAHFKGHELAGFGGTIKNLGMGCASRRGKLAQHSSVSPKITKKKCVNCGECAKHCSQDAIEVVKAKAEIKSERCIGCGECIIVCPNNAVKIEWSKSVPTFMEKMVEYTEGVVKSKKGKSLFLNFITDVSPACDCHPASDAPIVQNIGVLCSKDPVAIDKASVDLVNSKPALEKTCLIQSTSAGDDKFRKIYPEIDWEIQLKYAEEIGLGTCNYKLIQI